VSRLERNNAAALKAGQAAYDNAAPDDSVPFLQTADGLNWLHCAADDLVTGRDLKIGGMVRVESYLLADKLAGMALAAHETDQDGALGQILHAVAGGNLDAAKRALYMLVSKDAIQEAAEEIVAPFVGEYLESVREDRE
jgi:hypothetical protein